MKLSPLPLDRGRLARRVACATICALTVGACRSDSVLSPGQSGPPDCGASECPPPPRPGASTVVVPLEDAATRIVTNMPGGRARAALSSAITDLRGSLLTGNETDARLALARAYDALDLAEREQDGSTDRAQLSDPADLAAIRLSLVPVASALGVVVR